MPMVSCIEPCWINFTDGVLSSAEDLPDISAMTTPAAASVTKLEANIIDFFVLYFIVAWWLEVP